jgi:hypothetical protein
MPHPLEVLQLLLVVEEREVRLRLLASIAPGVRRQHEPPAMAQQRSEPVRDT